MNHNSSSCAVVYSGGTDSLCVAALMAQKYSNVHLLTYYEDRTLNKETWEKNIHLLKKKYSTTQILAQQSSVKNLVKKISYMHYFKYLKKYGFLVLSTPGFTSLSWHISTIVYCLKNNISVVADGLTKELIHFPGHMDEIVVIFKKLYEEFGITYTNPVRDWDTPQHQQFLDRVVVDQHGFLFPFEDESKKKKKTTGQYLFQEGILPHPNVKGSKLDRMMQQDCYPFVLYNIMAFWYYLAFEPYEVFCGRMAFLFHDKVEDAKKLINELVND